MLARNNPDRIQIAFDDHRMVANAGLLLPATLALHLGLGELVDYHLDLGGAPGRANTGDKLLTLAGVPAGVLSCAVKAPSTLGTFLRSFRWGHVRQLDRVSREPAGPGLGPLGPDPATRRSPSTLIHHLRDLRTGTRRGRDTTAIPASGGITRFWPWPQAPATC